MMANNRCLPLEDTPEYKYLMSLGLPKEDYAIFGSGPLIKKGLKPLKNDLDVIARGLAWEKTTLLGHPIDTPFKRGKRVVLFNGRIEIYNEWISEKYDVNELIDEAEIINGIKFVALHKSLNYKKDLWRPKDIEDIRSIIDYEISNCRPQQSIKF